MPNFSFNFAGQGAIVATSIVATGDITGNRFLAGDGAVGTPSFSFTADPIAPTPLVRASDRLDEARTHSYTFLRPEPRLRAVPT